MGKYLPAMKIYVRYAPENANDNPVFTMSAIA
jgi:hypothetical protein